MQCAIDGRYIQDHFPGIGRYTCNLIDALARVAPDDTFVVLHNPALRNTRYDVDALAHHPNIELRDADIPTFSLREQWQIPAALRRVRTEVYHSPYYIMPYLPGCTTIVTIHDLVPLRYPFYFTPIQRLIFNATIRLAVHAAQKVITVSSASADDLLSLLRVPRERVVEIAEAADPAFTPQSRETIDAVRARHQLPESYILYVGSNKPHKNLVRLVNAFAHVRQCVPHTPLVIAGQWDARYTAAERRAADWGLGDSVRWLANVPSADLPALYAGATLFVFPSEYEGFGLPALEAMACGAPVVCSNAASLPEVVGDAAILVNPRDVGEIAVAMERVLCDAALRDELRAKSLARAAQFSWERTARETLRVYESLIKQGI